MANHRWRERPDVVARLVETGSIGGWSSRNIVLKPNESVAILADGKVQDIVTETVLRDYVGGFSRWLGAKLGMGAADHKLIFALTGPLDLVFPMEGVSADGHAVRGAAVLRVRIDRDDVPKLLNIFASHPRELTRTTLVQMFAREVEARVIRPLIAGTPAAMIGGEAWQTRFEGMARAELRTSLETGGLTLMKGYAGIDENAWSTLMQAKAEVDRKVSTDVRLASTKAQMQVAREDLAARTEIAMAAFEQVQAAKRARQAQTDAMQSSVLGMAVEAGALTPEVVQTFLRQQTAQKRAEKSL